jgi:hypothetical protein
MMGMAALTMACMTGCSDDADSTQPAANQGTTKQSLYERLGKKEGIAQAVTAVVDAELKDTEMASYFFFQVQTPVPAGHPSRAQIEECFVLQLSEAAGGPEKYAGAKVSGGFTCRDMTTAHKGLGIPEGIFERFITIAAGVLKGAGVAEADINVIGGVLMGEKDTVAQDKSRKTGSFIKPQ